METKKERRADNQRKSREVKQIAEREKKLMKKGVAEKEIIKHRPKEYVERLMDNDTARGIVFPETASTHVDMTNINDTPYAECLICFQPMAKAIGYDPKDMFKQKPIYAFVCKCGQAVTTDKDWSAPYTFGYKIPPDVRSRVDKLLLSK